MMVSRTVQFNCDETLHMKAIAVLIQKASTFRSSLWLSRGDRKANAKSLLGVMSLGIDNDVELLVTADGKDEAEALDAIANYLGKPEF